MHDLTLRRKSSRVYNPQRNVSKEIVENLLESVRWAPSSRNRQPWQYIVFDNNTPKEKDKMLALLGDGNRQWAKNAPVLILSMARVMYDDKLYTVGYHDLGLANENLMLTAVQLGLHVCPMGGFDKIGAIAQFNIPSEFRPVAVFSIGYPGRVEDYPPQVQERETRIRSRKSIDEFVFYGSLESPYEPQSELTVKTN
jgi:nitroreductase